MPLVADTLVRTFVWAQWDVVHQTLYYIHFRKPIKSLVEGEDLVVNDRAMPTLSGLQFHDDLPHETVVSLSLLFEAFIVLSSKILAVEYSIKFTA